MLKLNQKKLLVSLLLAAFIVLGVAATPPDEPKRNLKVLPKNISHDDLTKIMRGFTQAMGQKCDFCHAQSKTEAGKMDFASDEKGEKETARFMIKMTNKINKKFFESGKSENKGKPLTVSCYTCHKGNPHPEGPPPLPEPQH